MNDKTWPAHVGHLAVPTVSLAGGVLLAEAGLWEAKVRYGLPDGTNSARQQDA